MNPTATTTSFVQNGQAKIHWYKYVQKHYHWCNILPIKPLWTSSAARSINTNNDHTTHIAATKWNRIAQNSLRLSTLDISKRRHWKHHFISEIIHVYLYTLIHTSLMGLILVCKIKLNLHNSQDLVSDAVSHCCKHDWWTYLRLPEQ